VNTPPARFGVDLPPDKIVGQQSRLATPTPTDGYISQGAIDVKPLFLLAWLALIYDNG
jgi:hypothetical protein